MNELFAGSSGGDSGGGGGGVNASVNNIADINAYFVRRKGQKPKREQLFRFDYSHTALTMNDYLKEQNSDVRNVKLAPCVLLYTSLIKISEHQREVHGVPAQSTQHHPHLSCFDGLCIGRGFSLAI